MQSSYQERKIPAIVRGPGQELDPKRLDRRHDPKEPSAILRGRFAQERGSVDDKGFERVRLDRRLWGFAEFDDGKLAGKPKHGARFSCHAAVSAHDFVFNRYAP
jgi:hypothetical protein